MYFAKISAASELKKIFLCYLDLKEKSRCFTLLVCKSYLLIPPNILLFFSSLIYLFVMLYASLLTCNAISWCLWQWSRKLLSVVRFKMIDWNWSWSIRSVEEGDRRAGVSKYRNWLVSCPQLKTGEF